MDDDQRVINQQSEGARRVAHRRDDIDRPHVDPLSWRGREQVFVAAEIAEVSPIR